MNTRELYDLWQPVWEKCPELKPEDFLFDGLYGVWQNSSCRLIEGHPAESIINWTVMEWLAKKGWVLRSWTLASGREWFCYRPDDGFTSDSCNTPTKALNAAVRAVLEMG